MTIEISVTCIAVAFVLLVIFAIAGIISVRRTLKEMNRLMHAAKKELEETNVEGLKLIKHLNETTVNVNKKLHALDGFFKPFEAEGGNDLVSDIMQCLAAGMLIYKKIKGGFKEYGKR